MILQRVFLEKADFFFNDSQKMMQLYDDIYRDAAQYKLLVNAHGSNPPSGEIRTYPNAIAREAIRGQEQGGISVDEHTFAYKPSFLDADDTYTAIIYHEKGEERQALDMRVINDVRHSQHRTLYRRPESYGFH